MRQSRQQVDDQKTYKDQAGLPENAHKLELIRKQKAQKKALEAGMQKVFYIERAKKILRLTVGRKGTQSHLVELRKKLTEEEFKAQVAIYKKQGTWLATEDEAEEKLGAAREEINNLIELELSQGA